ncbi:MAG TPA: type II CAAX endopeptidase family protein [Gammaproteobacteria bacterium]
MTEQEGPPLTKRQAAVDVLLTIALVPVCSITAGVVVGALSGGEPSLAAIVFIQALLVLAGVGMLLEWRAQRWSQIGLHAPERRDLARALLVLLSGFAVNAVLTYSVAALSPQTVEEHLEGLRPIALGLTEGTPLVVTLALLVVVGLYEEILARGLLLTRARQLLGGVWAPVALSAVLFSLGHFYQGLFGMVQTALYGAVLAVFTIRWGTLWPAIIAHSAFNTLSVVQLGQVSSPGG